jgi:hypothetical protein
MQYADQSEEPPRGLEVDIDLAFQPLDQQFRALIVNAAPGHVDGFDLGSAGLADCLIIAVANREIIPDRSPEAAQSEYQRLQRFAIFPADGDDQPAFLNAQAELIGAGIAILVLFERLEIIFLDQIEDRDPPFLLDIGIAPQNRGFIEFDRYDARIGHCALLPQRRSQDKGFCSAACRSILSTGLSPEHFQFFRGTSCRESIQSR